MSAISPLARRGRNDATTGRNLKFGFGEMGLELIGNGVQRRKSRRVTKAVLHRPEILRIEHFAEAQVAGTAVGKHEIRAARLIHGGRVPALFHLREIVADSPSKMYNAEHRTIAPVGSGKSRPRFAAIEKARACPGKCFPWEVATAIHAMGHVPIYEVTDWQILYRVQEISEA